jgi:hypothetical protein
MQATRAMEQRNQRQDTESQRDSKLRNTPLDARYGRIGISAVAAAVRHMGESRPRAAANSKHALRYERE